MIVDALLAVSGSITGNTITGQSSLFGNGTTVVSANTVDLGTTRDIGEGQDIYGRVEIVSAVTGGTTAEFQFIAADANNLTGNVTVIGTTGAIPVASLTAGARFSCKLNPRLASKGQQYLGMQCVNVGNNASVSGAYADIGMEIADNKVYASGFAVL